MNRTARLITAAAISLPLLAFSPKALFSQSKPAPDPIKKEITRLLKGKKGAKTLNCGDTLRVSGNLPEGARKVNVVPFKSANVQVLGSGRKAMLIGGADSPGYFSGQLRYKQSGRAASKDISLVFLPGKEPTTFVFSHLFKDFVEVPLPSRPKIPEPRKTPNRSFFGASSISPTCEGVGLGVSYSFNVPYVDIMIMKHWALNNTNNWAFNVMFEFSGSARQKIEGNFYKYQNIQAISKDVVAANNFTVSPYPVFEIGNAVCSALFGPKVTLFHRSGNIRPVTVYANGFITEGDPHSYSFWKATIGMYLGVKVNAGKHISITLDYDPSYAFMIAGRRVERQDMAEDGRWNLGNIGIGVVYNFSMIK